VLLDAWGELDYFDCETCSAYDKRELGCGTAPIVEAPDTLVDFRARPQKTRPRYWTPGLWHEQAEMRQEDLSAELAEDLYPFAAWGGVVGATGSPFRCCPAWYARFSPPGAIDAVHHAAKLLRWRESGALSAITSGTLQQWEIDLVEIASRMHNAKEQRDMQARRAQAEATSRAAGRG